MNIIQLGIGVFLFAAAITVAQVSFMGESWGDAINFSAKLVSIAALFMTAVALILTALAPNPCQ